jgi:FG-GAP repeat
MRNGRLIFLAASFSVLCLGSSYLLAGDQTAETSNLSSLPAAAQSSVSTALGRDIRSYHAQRRGSKFLLENELEDTRADFGTGGVELQSATAQWRMTLRGYGYGDALRAARSVSPNASFNRVEYRRDGLTEAYVNGPGGLEQGIILDKPPGDRMGRPLTVAFDVSGDADAVKGEAVSSQRPRLVATDADGRNLFARSEKSGKQLLLKVEDAGAKYPVTISYWAQVAKLRSSNIYAYHFGITVAMSGDVVVVGAPYGFLADVFIKPKGQWSANMTEVAQLNPPVHTECNLFGSSVAISGNTIVVGDQKNCSKPGTVYVFVEPVGGWSGSLQPTAALTASDGVGFNALGWSVSISGNTVVAGAPATYLTNGVGAAYVFVKPAKQWINATETAKLTSSDGAANNQLGYSVAISGNTIVAGEPNGPVDGVCVYLEPAGGWTNMTQTAKLTASDGPNLGVGGSVAISGGTVVGGAPFETIGGNQAQGAAYVFVEPAGGWTNMTQTAKLTASGGASLDELGSAVAVSGNVVVAGAPRFSGQGFFGEGGAFVFMKPATGWANETQAATLTGSDARGSSALGSSLAIEGSTIVAGAAFNKRSFDGAAYIFGNFQY